MPRPSSPVPDWPGFDLPAYTQTPDAIFDVWLPHLSGAELKVLLYIVRHTFGYRKDADNISISQFLHGIEKLDGTGWQDHGTGLSQPAITAAVRRLVALGLVTATRQTARSGGDAPTRYSLIMRGSKESLHPRPKKVRTGGQLRAAQGAKPVRTQETIQQTEGQEEPARVATGETLAEYAARFAAQQHERNRR